MLCCIGGVCVPVTAVVPICVLALKWIVDRLAAYGLLPDSIVRKMQALGLNVVGAQKGDAKAFESSGCCSNKDRASSGDAAVKALSSEDEFEAVTKDPEAIVVCKFTADWCQPCKRIQPVFEEWATENAKANMKCYTIDVDDFDDIASHYKIAMMPTFLVLKNNSVIDTYRGSHVPELRKFLDDAMVTVNGDAKACEDSGCCSKKE